MSIDSASPERRCLDRTKSAVLNVMVVEGALIAISGWILGRRDSGALAVNPLSAWRFSIAGLFAILLISRAWLRIGAAPSSLRNPSTRRRRFAIAHVGSASVGALAVPLGFVYGWGVEPTLQAIAPFWVAALATGFLSLPKAAELEGFEFPMPEPARGSEVGSR